MGGARDTRRVRTGVLTRATRTRQFSEARDSLRSAIKKISPHGNIACILTAKERCGELIYDYDTPTQRSIPYSGASIEFEATFPPDCLDKDPDACQCFTKEASNFIGQAAKTMGALKPSADIGMFEKFDNHLTSAIPGCALRYRTSLLFRCENDASQLFPHSILGKLEESDLGRTLPCLRLLEEAPVVCQCESTTSSFDTQRFGVEYLNIV